MTTVTDNVGNTGTCSVSVSSYDCSCKTYYEGICTCRIDGKGFEVISCENLAPSCKADCQSLSGGALYSDGCTSYKECKTCYK